MADLTVAKTILEQMGGGRLKVMTGAHTFIGDMLQDIFEAETGLYLTLAARR